MKNREKYAEEIKNYNGTNFCKDFIQPVVFNRDNCNLVACGMCAMLTALWLDEEYTQPEVDWSKIAVDTPIIVRDSKTGNWYKRYFAKFADGKVYAWFYGKTSWTSDNEPKEWKYAKLAEQEESDE